MSSLNSIGANVCVIVGASFTGSTVMFSVVFVVACCGSVAVNVICVCPFQLGCGVSVMLVGLMVVVMLGLLLVVHVIGSLSGSVA